MDRLNPRKKKSITFCDIKLSKTKKNWNHAVKICNDKGVEFGVEKKCIILETISGKEMVKLFGLTYKWDPN